MNDVVYLGDPIWGTLFHETEPFWRNQCGRISQSIWIHLFRHGSPQYSDDLYPFVNSRQVHWANLFDENGNIHSLCREVGITQFICSMALECRIFKCVLLLPYWKCRQRSATFSSEIRYKGASWFARPGGKIQSITKQFKNIVNASRFIFIFLKQLSDWIQYSNLHIVQETHVPW